MRVVVNLEVCQATDGWLDQGRAENPTDVRAGSRAASGRMEASSQHRASAGIIRPGMAKSIGRNDPCSCGSGKKFKRCCIDESAAATVPQVPPSVIAALSRRPASPEPHIQFVPSVVHKGNRMRAVWSGIYARPLHETFHEFLINLVKWTLGREWWAHQVAMAENLRHPAAQWVYAFGGLTKAAPDVVVEEAEGRKIYSVTQSGPVAALLQFGYDLLCLQQKNRLPAHTVAKLRDDASFQGARYEIAVAAVMARAGCEIEFLDDASAAEKHCEFIATYRETGAKVGIEAKSRLRAGVLNRPGTFEYDGDARGIQNLIRKAKKQRPSGLPFFIFLDVNLPSSAHLPPDEKPWIQDLRRAGRGGSAASVQCDLRDEFRALLRRSADCVAGSRMGLCRLDAAAAGLPGRARRHARSRRIALTLWHDSEGDLTFCSRRCQRTNYLGRVTLSGASIRSSVRQITLP